MLYKSLSKIPSMCLVKCFGGSRSQEVQPRTAQYMLVVLSGGILQDDTFLAMLEADKS